MTKTTLGVSLFVLIAAAGPGDKKAVRFQEDREQSCRNCHRFTSGLSHVMDKPVNQKTDLPLRQGKRIGCQTCHEADPDHGKGDRTSKRDRASKRDRTNRVRLRRPRRALCESCHKSGGEAGSKIEHAMLLGRAHLESKRKRMQGDLRRMDPETRTCMECHDGSVTQASGHERLRWGARGEHPVGVEYRPGRRKGLNLRSAWQLPRSVRLPGGRVGCGSCHSPFSRLDNMLTQTTRLGKLCLACHDM